MRPFLYILFFLSVVGLLQVSTMLLPVSDEVSSAAEEAGGLISTSRLYAKDHAYNRSLHHLELAMKTIREIEQQLDPESQKTVDMALVELETVHREISEHKLNNTDMNHAFTKTMNALTFAELKVTQHYLQTEDFHEAMAALKSGMIHMENALKFADRGHLAYELHIYSEIDSLLEHPELSKEQVVIELDKMLGELNTMVAE